jgi:hypothetical protein
MDFRGETRKCRLPDAESDLPESEAVCSADPDADFFDESIFLLEESE